MSRTRLIVLRSNTGNPTLLNAPYNVPRRAKQIKRPSRRCKPSWKKRPTGFRNCRRSSTAWRSSDTCSTNKSPSIDSILIVSPLSCTPKGRRANSSTHIVSTQPTSNKSEQNSGRRSQTLPRSSMLPSLRSDSFGLTTSQLPNSTVSRSSGPSGPMNCSGDGWILPKPRCIVGSVSLSMLTIRTVERNAKFSMPAVRPMPGALNSKR